MLKRMFLLLALIACLAAPSWGAEPHEGDAAKTDHAAAKVHEGGEHEAPPPLLPDPTDPETWKQAIWVVIIFVVLLAVLYPTAWKNVLAGLKAREQRIRQDIADAEAARKRAEETLKEYNAQLATAEARVRDMLTKAVTDGERLAAQIRTQAQKEAEEIKERTAKDLESAKHQAIAEIYEQAATLSTNVAEKILRRNLNANDQRDLVAQSLEQLQTIGKR